MNDKITANISIPKIIHYCWFGYNPLPEYASNCINSWKKYSPDYEIMRWDESNFDVNCCSYVKDAYDAKKWAFVSDYARFWILYNFGGIYFDTDVEQVKSIDDIVRKGPFMGIEDDGRYNVAPGLGIACEKGNSFYKDVLEYYEKLEFVVDGVQNLKPVGEHVSDMLIKLGYKKKNVLQEVRGITIYPVDYFCPKNVLTGAINITVNTRTIHHYSASWNSGLERFYRRIENGCASKGKVVFIVGRLITLPLRVANKIFEKGILGTIKFIPVYFKRK